jgi:hypothetical protein
MMLPPPQRKRVLPTEISQSSGSVEFSFTFLRSGSIVERNSKTMNPSHSCQAGTINGVSYKPRETLIRAMKPISSTTRLGFVCWLGQRPAHLCAERSTEPCMCPSIKSMLTGVLPRHATNLRLQVAGDRIAPYKANGRCFSTKISRCSSYYGVPVSKN